uniref:C-type lectin F n=1 Tax=Echis coloratus TaxID=64175 RepID=A0A0A1WCM3_ECHCO
MGRFISVSFGLLVVFLSLSETGADCLPGWSSHEGHCYKVFSREMKWADAEKFCSEQANGGHLVSIESAEEADFVSQLVSRNIKSSTSYVWIGLSYEGPSKQCSSEWSDGSTVTYENWNKEEPRKCVGLEEKTEFRKWVNLYCEQSNHFTCEI